MEISQILKQMLLYPDTPKTYRDLKKYYLSKGKLEEAEGFDAILRERYKILDVDDPSSDKK